MNNYEKIKEMVLPFLEAHESDLLVYDKKALENYKGDFLYAFRPYGTNNFKLLAGYDLEKDLISQVNSSRIFFIGNNKWFLYCKNGVIKSITKDEANKIFDKYISEKIIPLQEEIKKLNIPLMATNLYYFIQVEKRFWKANLNNFIDVQKLKSKISFKVLKLINKNTTEAEIRSLLYKNIKIQRVTL